jgi:soluble lytic murein transglycosylase
LNSKGLLSISIIILALSNAFAYSVNKPLTKSIEDYTNNANNNDLRAAKTIAEIHKKLRSKRETIRINLSPIKKSKLFNSYYDIAKKVLSKDFCSIKKNDLKTDHISEILVNTANKKCFREFIKKVEDNKNLTLNDLTYIKENFHSLLKKPFDETLANIAKSSDTETSRQLKQLVKQKYIRREIKPSSHFINILEIDTELTSLLQEIKYYSKIDKQYIYTELNKLFKLVKNSIKSNETEDARVYLSELVEFHSKNKKIIKDYNFDKKLHLIARLTLKTPDLQLQKDVFNFSKKLKEEDSFNETIFQIIFNFINQEEPYLAIKFIADKKLLSKVENLSSKNRYWIARAFEMNREITQAKELYVKQIELLPFSFYSILSLERLKILNPSYDTRFLVKQSYKKNQFTPSIKGDLEIKKMDAWLKTGEYRFFNAQRLSFINQCPTILENNREEDLNCHQVLVKLFSKNDHFIESFKLAYRFMSNGSLELDDTLLETLFPIRYQSLISKSGISDKIILSLIRQESGFNRFARSTAGAMGLMQLMPATAKIFKRNVTKRKLYNPNLNIKIGSRYLKYLLKKYDGNLTYVFAAYNAGEGNLKRWIRDGRFKGTSLDNIEQIPFHETRMYVKLLYRNMFFYNILTAQRKVSSINSENSLLNYQLKR